jgi:hypothetical protein
VIKSVRSGECKVAEGGVLSFNAFRGEEFVRGEFEPASFLWGGDPVQEVLKVLKGSEVSSRAYTRVPVVGVTTGGWKRRRESVGVGRGERRDGSRQALASAGGGTVQSDLRRGASETGTVPTARVCHKEPFRARPHPSPEPARWSACTSGWRAGGNRVSGPCRGTSVILDWNRYLGAPQRGPGVIAGALWKRWTKKKPGCHARAG